MGEFKKAPEQPLTSYRWRARGELVVRPDQFNMIDYDGLEAVVVLGTAPPSFEMNGRY